MKATSHQGFSLLELLLAIATGLVVGTAVIQTLLANMTLTNKLIRHQRQQELAQRVRRLVESDLNRAEGLATGGATAGCNLSGRTPVLQLSLDAGLPPISYTRGTAPSPIWGGEVLMRCGPALGLDGSHNLQSSWQNRVVLDELQDQSRLLTWLGRLQTQNI